MREPVLAAKTLPPSDGYKVHRTMRVVGGLHFIKSNGKPYFSITVDVFRKGFPNQCQSGGANHELILKHYPRFADLVDLHLSDIDGQPMGAEANGWYYLAGALGGMSERYTALTSKYHFPITPPADKPWQNTEYREPTRDECLTMFAKHCRIPLREAQELRDKAKAATLPNAWGQDAHCAKASRDVWRAFCESLKPYWKTQAEQCIAKHNLQVFGDAWPEAA